MATNTVKTGVVNAVNDVRAHASKAYQDAVPKVTKASLITEISNPILNYEPFMNEFIDGLVNRIAFTMISNKIYNNPLSILKKGNVPLGTDIQDIFTNPAEAEQYSSDNVAMAKLLTVTDPDTKVAYYRRNRQDLYPVTIKNEELTGAFTSWDKLEDLIASIVNSLYSGNYIDEFNLTKALFSDTVSNNKMIIEQVTEPTDEQSAKAFVQKVKTVGKMMSFPSTKYNAYSQLGGSGKPVKTWTEPDRLVFIVRADIMALVDVEVLARAFNMDKTEFMGRVYEVDEFTNTNLLGIIADESFIQVWDNLFKFTEFYNARTMSWNYYLHVWQTYAISPFANAVAFVTDLPVVQPTGIEVEPTQATISVDETLQLNATVLPANTTSKTVTYESSVPANATVDSNGKVTGVKAGTTVITARTSNGITAQVNITVE